MPFGVRKTLTLITGVLVLLTVLCSACSKPADPDVPWDYSSDARLVVERVESAHPAFILDEIPDGYEATKTEYLDTVAKNKLLRNDFLLATQKYLAVLRDGHMGAGFIRLGRYIDVQWMSIDNRFYLVDSSGKVTEEEVILIGDVPVELLQQQVDAHYFAENDSARQLYYEGFCRQEEMLRLAGCRYEDTIEIVTRHSSGVENTVELGFVSSEFFVYRSGSAPYIVRHQMIGDVFYVDLRLFREGSDVTNTAQAMRDAVSEGCKKFIIDVRGNPGGNSNVGEELLEAMGMRPPQFGLYVCHSALSKKVRRYFTFEKITYREPNLSAAKRNDDIQLVVLTDRTTFSSATMLGVWVQDGKLGTIVGQPSANAPTSYGDMLRIQLPLSNVTLPISYKKFLRPDADADPDTLHPDILTGFDEDALEVALKYLSGD